MSKFTFEVFCGGYDSLAVSKERYTREQAIEIAKDEIGYAGRDYALAIGDCFVVHRAGINEDGEPCVGWWLEYSQRNRSCPAWAFHIAHSPANHCLENGYEHIHVATQAGEVKQG
mgnify:CR=1 FL=1